LQILLHASLLTYFPTYSAYSYTNLCPFGVHIVHILA